MISIPEEHELIAFFETEPTLLDADQPWHYNTLTFEFQSAEEKVTVHLSPAYGDLEIYWTQKNELRLNWRLYDLKEIVIDKTDQKECMRIIPNAENMTETLLFLKPVVKIIGGMTYEP